MDHFIFSFACMLAFVAFIGATVYFAFGLLVRLVKAHERTAAALEELAGKDR